MIVAAIVIINPEIVNFPIKPYNTREAVTLEDSFLGELYPIHFQGQWLIPPSKKTQDSNNNQAQQDEPDELLLEDGKNIKSLLLNPFSKSKFTTNESNLKSPINQTIQNQQFTAPKMNTLLSNSSLLHSVDYDGFKLSPSKRYLLIWTNRIKQFRHSFTAKFYIYDIKLDLILLISTEKTNPQANFENLDSAAEYLKSEDTGSEFTRFQHVEWFSLPNKNNDGFEDILVLVQNNDVFLMKGLNTDLQDVNKRVTSVSPIRLSFTGKANEIFNGVPDWLYEEEILADVPAYQVSPRASNLAYMSFNDSLVDLMPFTIYGGYGQIIPQTKQIRYSKTGRPNPTVSVHVIEKLDSLNGDETVKSTRITIPHELSQKQHYIFRIKWLTEDKLGVSWLNRNQNDSYFLICSSQSNWNCEINLHQIAQNGWLDMSDDFYPLDNNHYLALLLKDEGPEVGKFKHVAKISIAGQDSFTFITNGKREVVGIDGLDRKRSLLYYTATVEGEPGQRQTNFVNFETGLSDTCLTCNLYSEECRYNSIKLSPSAEHYVFECHGPGVPRYELRSIKHDNRHQTDELLLLLEDNLALKYRLTHTKAMPLTFRLKVPIPDTNYYANVLMLLPPQLGYRTASNLRGLPQSSSLFSRIMKSSHHDNVGASINQSPGEGFEQLTHQYLTPETINLYTSQLVAGQQFPMVVDVYGGPNSQKVDFRFSVNFGHYMASSRRAIYVMIDGRGSGYEGTNRLYELYHKFGTVEIQDQIDTVVSLAQTYSFIDPNKVAIWGWSYGGYAAAMALAHGNRSYKRKIPPSQLKSSSSTTSKTQLHLQSSPARSPTAIPVFKDQTRPLAGETTGVFECAASVAPVTNWIYYDTAYTERYMSSPYLNEFYDNLKGNDHLSHSSEETSKPSQELINRFLIHNMKNNPLESSLMKSSIKPNEWLILNQTITNSSHLLIEKFLSKQKSNQPTELNLRYKVASLIENIKNIDKKRYLLIHGTADDNVHFQQSIMLMKQMIGKGILYESRLYPDQDHAIGMGSKLDKLHLGSTLSNFFAECFDK